MQYSIYDEYHDEYYSESHVETLVSAYLTWCKSNNQEPEIQDEFDITEENIGHVAYHANMLIYPKYS